MTNSENTTPNSNEKWGSLLPVVTASKRGIPEGRKPAITPTVLERLREAFLIGCDDLEACLNAGIAPSTLYAYQKTNPAFMEWKEALKRHPFLKARKTIVEHLERDPEFALKYMERKKRQEFAPNAKLTIEDNRGVLDDEATEKAGDILSQHLQKLAERKERNADSPSHQPI